MFASTSRRKGPPVSTEPFEQACAASRQVLAGVRADQLANATPCASWDVAGLINHIVGGQHFFADGMEGKPPSESGDYASGDYMDSFDQAAARVTAVFQQDGALGRMAKMPFGEMPGGAVLGIATSDVFVHGWDLAKATEQDTNLAPELAARMLEGARQNVQDNIRGPEGAPFGPEQQCADGAYAADQLAAFLGRQV
jgi:uncharacterized protein (TIGR03086 family)